MASRFDRKVRMLVVGALAIAALAASPAPAKGPTTTRTCIVDPSTVYGSSPVFTVSGSGFPAGMIVNLWVKDRITKWIVYGGNLDGGIVGSDGTFSIANIDASIFYPSDLGKKTISVTNALDTRQRTLCQCTFWVQ